MRAPFVEGQYVESGAEWVDTHHHRMRAPAAIAMDMHLQGEGQQWTTIRRWLHRDGRLQSPADLGDAVYRQLEAFEAIVDDAAQAVDDPGATRSVVRGPQRTRRACRLPTSPSGPGSAIWRALFHRRDSQGEFAAEPDEVSLLFVAQQRASEPHE